MILTQPTNKTILTSLIITIVVIAALFGVWKLTSKPTSPPKTLELPIKSTDWVKGNKQAKVVLIEYSDFQCPACGFYYPIVKRLSETFTDKIAIVYRHFPLLQHKNAKKAAHAAEAAGKQGKFWEMHDLIFKNQTDWSEKSKPEELFIAYAKSLNLKEDQFTSDMKSATIKAKVDLDLTSGQEIGLAATPTFFLNGQRLDNPGNFDNFKQAVEATLESTGK